MAQEVDWGSLGGTEGKTSKSKFLKFEAGKMHTFRPVGGSVKFYRFFVQSPNGNKSIYVDPGQEVEAEEILSKHFGREVAPTQRFAINIIDREDGQIKILEGGWSIFKYFSTWFAANEKKNPGGPYGGDWFVSVEGEKLNRRYTTGFMRPAPFTQDELKKIKAEKNGLYTLSEVYKATPLDKLIEVATGSAPAEEETFPTGVEEMPDELSDDPKKW